MRPWLPLLLLATALSGCVSEDPADPEAGADPDLQGPSAEAPGLPGLPAENGTLLDEPLWNITAEGCATLVASVPLLGSAARNELPTGFEPTPFQGTPETAGAALVVNRCARAVTPEAEYLDHQEVLVYVYVEPPAEYRVDGIDLYRMIIRHGVSSADLVAEYGLSNVTVQTVTALATQQPLGDLRAIEAKATFPDMTFSFRSPVGPFGATQETPYRLFTMEDNQVTGALDLVLSASSVHSNPAGTYVVESGQLFGRPAGPALVVDYDAGEGIGYTLTPVKDLGAGRGSTG